MHKLHNTHIGITEQAMIGLSMSCGHFHKILNFFKAIVYA